MRDAEFVDHDFSNVAADADEFIEWVGSELYGCRFLRGADLTRASVTQVQLQKADLRGSKHDGVDLKELDLKDVRLDMGQAVLLARSYGANVE